MDPHELLRKYPPLSEVAEILEKLILTNRELALSVIELAMAYGIYEAERKIRIEYSNLARVSPPNSVHITGIDWADNRY